LNVKEAKICKKVLVFNKKDKIDQKMNAIEVLQKFGISARLLHENDMKVFLVSALTSEFMEDCWDYVHQKLNRE